MNDESFDVQPQIIIGQDPEGRLICLLADLPKEPSVVGIMLADTLRHVASTYAGDDASDSERARIALTIWSALKAEMSNPTDDVKLIENSGDILLVGEHEKGEED